MINTDASQLEAQATAEGQGAMKIYVLDEASRQDATNWLVKIRATRKKIEESGLGPIKKMREQIRSMQVFVERLTAPLKNAESHLNDQIGLYVMKEREAARKLQAEENARVARETEQRMNESIEEIPPEPVLPDIVPMSPKSTVADTGETVSVRMLSTYNVGKTIIDGKAVEGADLSVRNPDFVGLPSHLFEINLAKLRSYVKAGDLRGTMIQPYKKPSTATREA